MARSLDATSQEVSRNFSRLFDAGFIIKDSDGFYYLSTFGNVICTQVSSMKFFSQNRKYFKKHELDSIPLKFIHRMGELEQGNKVKGFIKVQEKWDDIYKNADQYIHNILHEVSYSSNIIEILVKKIKNKTQVKSVFSSTAIVSSERKNVLEKNGLKKFIQEGMITRRMKKDVKVALVLNEKEACISFPTLDGEAELSQAFYSNVPSFQEWCLDYFVYCWDASDVFQESNLNK